MKSDQSSAEFLAQLPQRLDLLEKRLQGLADMQRQLNRFANRTRATQQGLEDVLVSFVAWAGGNAPKQTRRAVAHHAAVELDRMLKALKAGTGVADDDRDADEIPLTAPALPAIDLRAPATGTIPAIQGDVADIRAELRAITEHVSEMMADYTNTTPKAMQAEIGLRKAKLLAESGRATQQPDFDGLN